MATRSVIAYKDSDGQVRGTYVHYDGNPARTIPALNSRIQKEGFDGLTRWIENGIKGSGYWAADEDQGIGDPGGDSYEVTDEEYGYLVSDLGAEVEVQVFEETKPLSIVTI